jgi:hypothetical protein
MKLLPFKRTVMAGRTGSAAMSDGGAMTGPATAVERLALEDLVSARLESCWAIEAVAASEIAVAAS